MVLRGNSSPDHPERDLGRRVREVVTRLLDSGAPDVRAVAGAVHTSPRTLQRRLHDAGLTYARLVQQVRCEEATHLLVESDQAVAQVARRLGYSDPAHFTRAFQRWTGLTPREFRRRGHRGAAAPLAPRRVRTRRR